ncbi:MAG: hypothetical protein SRB2_02915 [Desulfobacteraceae bacterium Eth-SRB2]|nr:MAG: hypothetical protein SRB2_02915 [Desulfobacteraceae bacterium Eth-SRB2]
MNSILVSKLKCFKRVSSLIASAAKHLESLGYRQGTIGNHAYPVDTYVPLVSALRYQHVQGSTG